MVASVGYEVLCVFMYRLRCLVRKVGLVVLILVCLFSVWHEMTPPSRGDLGKLKLAELQRQLEAKGMDSTGKKADMVDRLWAALQDAGEEAPDLDTKATASDTTGEKQCDQPISKPSAEMLMRKLKLIKQRYNMEESRLKVRARAEQDDLTLQMRAEQLDVEIQLAELGQADEIVLESLRVPVGDRQESSPETSALSVQVGRFLLPPAEQHPFSGAVEEFRLFMKSFQARIEKRTSDKGELLYYLEQYTRGKANQLVRSCLHLGEGRYEQALKLPESRYGNSIRLIDSYVDKVDHWSRLQSGDVEGLDKFALFLTEVQNAMSGVTMGEFEHPSTLRLIVLKLPGYLQDRWLRAADKMSEDGKRVTFSDLVSFISAEVRVKRSPLFGPRSSVSGCSYDTGSCQSRHKVSTARVSEPSSQMCVFCGAVHSLDACQALMQRPWWETRRVLMRHQLCFGCLRRGHRAQACRRPLRCNLCSGAHPSVMHREPGSEFVAPCSPGQSRVRQCGPPRAARPPGGVPGGLRPRPAAGPPGSVPGSLRPGPVPGGTAAASSSGPPVAPPSGGVLSASLGIRGAGRTVLPVVAVRLWGPTERRLW